MRITEEALMQAIRYTQNAQEGLGRNLQYMKSTTTPLLSEWHDAHVERFLQQLDLYDSYAKNVQGNMDRIVETLKAYLNMLQQYNS